MRTATAYLIGIATPGYRPPAARTLTSARWSAGPLAEIAGADKLPGRRFQRFRLLQRPGGAVVAIGGHEQLGGVVIQQAAAQWCW